MGAVASDPIERFHDVVSPQAFNLEDTKVPILIPLGLISIFAAIQLFLGTDPLLMALCAACVAVPLIPLHLFGRDLYSMIGIVFSLRYVGVALIAKTLYGQPLETHLYDPFAAYGLTLLLMIVLTTVLIVARALDHGTTISPFSMDPPSLRRLAIVAMGIGFVCEVIVGGTKSSESGGLNSGPIFVLAANLSGFFYLGLIAEAIHNITKSNYRTFISPVLAMGLLLGLLIAMGLNQREFFVSCVIAVIVTAFIYRMIRVQHLVLGAFVAVFFLKIMTPITLYLRSAKEGMDILRFLNFAQTTVVRAATEPAFFNEISNQAKSMEAVDPNHVTSNDYFGDGSNVLNRLSYIGLVDAVYNGTRVRVPIGMPALNQTIARVAPGFLGFDKNVSRYGLGDWFCWQTGLFEPESLVFANFALPMEGLATWGLAGFIAYPFLFLLPVLYVSGRISSFRLPIPASIFIFADGQHAFIETMSDGFLGSLTRTLPVFAILLFGLYKLFALYSAPAKPGSIATSNS
jgi:hypothetical protein